MTDIATLGLAVDSSGVVRATGDLDKFSAASDKAEKSAKGVGTTSTSAGRAAAAANDNAATSATKAAAAYSKMRLAVAGVAAALTAAFASGIHSAVGRLREMEQVNAQVNKALENADTMAGHSAESIRKWADELERSTGRAASEVMAVSANLASFGFNEDVFFRAIKLADDMAAAWGGDLRQNLEGLSRALENPEKGLAMLSARGITFTDEGRKMAMQLAATGRAAEAAAVLMDELEGQVKGVAEAGFTGLTKAMANARQAINAFFEAFVSGTSAMPALELALNAVAAAFRMLTEHIDRIITYGATAVTMFGTYYVGAMVAAYVSTMTLSGALAVLRVALLRLGITAIVVAAGELVYQFSRLVSAAGGFGNAMGLLGNVASEVIGRIVDVFSRLPAAIADVAIQMGEKFADGIRYGINEALILVGDFVAKLNSIAGTNIGAPNLLGPVRIDNPFAGSAAGLLGAATAPLESVEAIRRAMADAAGETNGAAEAVSRLNNGLSEMGEGGAGGAAKKALDKVKESADRAKDAIQNAKEALGQGFGGILDGLINKSMSWRDALMQAGRELLKYLNQMSMAQGGRGLFGGGFLQGLLGGLLGFASGGYTGPGAASQPAGIVHAGEYVMSKSAVDRLGVGYLDALHNAAKGYQMGGYVRSQAPANFNMRGYQSGGYVRPAPQQHEPLKIELVSRFDADGGFETAVAKTSLPIAQQESQRAAGKVASAVPSMVDGRTNEKQMRRIRPGGGF